VLALGLLVTGCVHAGTLRGQIDLHFIIRERGVAYYKTSQDHLQLELSFAADGAATLVVTGRGEESASFLGPPGQERATRSSNTTTDRWTGRARRTATATIVELEITTRHPHAPPDKLTLRCERDATPPPPDVGPLMRCTPTERFRGMPWRDPLPHYARVPLVLAELGMVLTSVFGDHEQEARVGPPEPGRPSDGK
jgi:hypothetical protein